MGVCARLAVKGQWLAIYIRRQITFAEPKYFDKENYRSRDTGRYLGNSPSSRVSASFFAFQNKALGIVLASRSKTEKRSA